jgi:hypothetical protein
MNSFHSLSSRHRIRYVDLVGEDGRAVLTSGGWTCDKNSSRVSDMAPDSDAGVVEETQSYVNK